MGGSVIPAAVKTPGNKLVRIIMPGINMVAVKKPDKKLAKIDSDKYKQGIIFFKNEIWKQPRESATK